MRMKNRGVAAWLVVIILLGSSISVPGQGSPQQPKRLGPGDHSLSVNVNGRERTYTVHVPPKYDGKTPMPVVLMFHGGGGTARGAIKETSWPDKADKAGFLAVFPEGSRTNPSKPARFVGNPQTWNDGSGRFNAGKQNSDDVGFTNALIDDLTVRFAVDPRRIFVSGFSNGSSLAYRLGVELSNRIAAIAPVSSSGLRLKNPSLSRPVSLIAIHETEDPLNPIEGGDVKLPRGEVDPRPPLQETILTWARMLGCPLEPKVVHDQDGVKSVSYAPCKDNSEIVFYTIEGMGHTWPGGRSLLPERLVGKETNKINADDVIWEFFQKHPKP